MKPEQKLTLEQIRDELPRFEYAVQDALRFFDNQVLANKTETKLLLEMEDMKYLFDHYINYEDK